jgi:hypothetical protein
MFRAEAWFFNQGEADTKNQSVKTPGYEQGILSAQNE